MTNLHSFVKPDHVRKFLESLPLSLPVEIKEKKSHARSHLSVLESSSVGEEELEGGDEVALLYGSYSVTTVGRSRWKSSVSS